MIPITKFSYDKKLCGQIQDIFNKNDLLIELYRFHRLRNKYKNTWFFMFSLYI